MDLEHWRKLRRDLTVSDNGLPSVKRPTVAKLKQWEKETGLLFPASYKAFIRVFGPGVLVWSYRIMAPGYPEQGDSVDLAKFNESAKNQFSKSVLRGMRDSERVCRVIYCVRTDAGDLIGWDPEEPTDRQLPEYAMYKFGRADHMERVADSFGLFIDDTVLSKVNLAIRPEEEEELGTRYLFEPTPDLSKE